MTPSADDRERARRRLLLQRRLLVLARRSERLTAPPTADEQPATGIRLTDGHPKPRVTSSVTWFSSCSTPLETPRSSTNAAGERVGEQLGTVPDSLRD